MNPRRSPRFQSILVGILVLSAASASIAGSPRPPAPPSPKPGGGEWARREAQGLRKMADEIAQRSAKGAARVQEAGQALAAGRRAEADALDRLAQAAEAGNQAEVRANREQRERARAAIGPLQEKLSAREAEQRNVLDDKLLERLARMTPPAAKAKLDALLAVRKAAAEAWAAVADSAAPGANLMPMKEKAITAEGAARIAARDHELSCEIARGQEEASRAGANVADLLPETKKLVDAALDAERKRVDLELIALRLETKRRELREAFRQRTEQARKAGQESKKIEKWLSDSW